MIQDSLVRHAPLLNVRQVARWLNISSRKVMYLTRDGALSGVRIGRALRFTEDDVKRFITSVTDKSLRHQSPPLEWPGDSPKRP